MAKTEHLPAVEPATPPEAMKRLNGLVIWILGSRLGKRMNARLMTLEFTGRRTGRTYRLPVGRQDLLGKRSVLTKRMWRSNFRGGGDARLRVDGAWHQSRGVLVEDVPTIARAYAEGIERHGWQNAKNTLGLKINVGRPPTLAELEQFVRSYGWYLIQFDLDDQGA
jgi:hypothetical protein